MFDLCELPWKWIIAGNKKIVGYPMLTANVSSEMNLNKTSVTAAWVYGSTLETATKLME